MNIVTKFMVDRKSKRVLLKPPHEIARILRDLNSDKSKEMFYRLVECILKNSKLDLVPSHIYSYVYGELPDKLKERFIHELIRQEPDQHVSSLLKKLDLSVDLSDINYGMDLIVTGKGICSNIVVDRRPENFDFSVDFKETNTQKIYSHALENVFLYGCKKRGFIVFDDVDVFSLSGITATKEYIDNKLKNKKNAIHVRELAFVGDNFRPHNYCHYFVDYIPRIYYLLHQYGKVPVGCYDFVSTEFQMQSLHTLFDVQNMQSLKRGVLYKISKLYMLDTSGTNFRHCFQGGLFDYFEPINRLIQSKINSNKSSKKRLFVDRNPKQGRLLENSLEVNAALRNAGYSSIDPGALPWSKQVEAFASTESIAGIHGAGLTNLLFSQDKSSIEIMPPNYGTNAFAIISKLCGHQYSRLNAVAKKPEHTQALDSVQSFELDKAGMKYLTDLQNSAKQ